MDNNKSKQEPIPSHACKKETKLSRKTHTLKHVYRGFWFKLKIRVLGKKNKHNKDKIKSNLFGKNKTEKFESNFKIKNNKKALIAKVFFKDNN